MNFDFGNQHTLHTLYLVCFCVGVGYVAISTLFSEICERLDNRLVLFKPSLFTPFLMVFGGVGLIAQHRTTSLFIVAGVAVLAAVTVSYLLYKYLIMPPQNGKDSDDLETLP